MKHTNLIASVLVGGAVMTAGAVQAGGVSDTEIVLGSHSALSGPVALWGAPAVEAMRSALMKSTRREAYTVVQSS